MELLKTIRDEWVVISTTPFTFVILAVLMFAAAYFVCRWRYTGTIEELNAGKETLTERLHLRSEQAESHREKATKYDQMLIEVIDSGTPELKEKTLSLVSDLREFKQRCAREDNANIFGSGLGREEDDTELARHQAWEQRTQKLIASSMERSEEYNRRFKVNTIILRDELRSRLPNYKSDEHDDFLYEHPTNNHGIEAVADDLERMAKTLS
ncbi:hypothetical protein HX805_20835 [Pseudomonas sp. G5001]|uniref:hypothetical protein n=1 Tax=Pseudomonas sp. G5001 TaxID=2738824 RepID=UPI0015A44C02|nr:hypothetical protein [Pseudomonas sp. G5001]NWB74907.1 hypothetical protein [Pseudomonas sp. G5001]